MLRKSWYWSNKKKILRSKQLLLKHHISAQNEGKHVLATSIFQNFLGKHAPKPPSRVTPAASQTTATPSKISLFTNKSTWEFCYWAYFTRSCHQFHDVNFPPKNVKPSINVTFFALFFLIYPIYPSLLFLNYVTNFCEFCSWQMMCEYLAGSL